MSEEITSPAVGSVNLLDVLTEGRELPRGYDSWGIKSVHPDLMTTNGFVYPAKGVAKPAGPLRDHRGSCPQDEGDGLCVATTWRAMGSGGISARNLLLVAYRQKDIIGDSEFADQGKLRVKKLYVVALIDGERLLVERASSANLSSANLRFADLSSANLSSANLRFADLSFADLRSANLRFADLSSANLRFADLRSANLRSANLRSADLSFANLSSANLSYAYTDEWTRLPSGIVVPK
jgi:hypothetical protein